MPNTLWENKINMGGSDKFVRWPMTTLKTLFREEAFNVGHEVELIDKHVHQHLCYS